MKKIPRQGGKGVDKRTEKEYNIEKVNKQVSPSGMASASQAVPGGFDSRRLLHIFCEKRSKMTVFLRFSGQFRAKM